MVVISIKISSILPKNTNKTIVKFQTSQYSWILINKKCNSNMDITLNLGNKEILIIIKFKTKTKISNKIVSKTTTSNKWTIKTNLISLSKINSKISHLTISKDSKIPGHLRIWATSIRSKIKIWLIKCKLKQVTYKI